MVFYFEKTWYNLNGDNMDYIAIDFETANKELCSACAIGIVGVENDKVAFEKYYLINPEMEFDPYNITIHHITSDDVKDSMTFEEVWEEIKDYFNGIVIAHNAMFDLNVLKALIEKYDLDVPDIKIACTLKISQKLWKDVLPNCKLNTISGYLEVTHEHHNALSDAYVCYKIIERAMKATNSSTITEVMESLGIIFGRYDDDKFFLPKLKYKDTYTFAKDNYFKGKIVCFGGKPKKTTKRKVLELLQIKGALISKNIDRSLDVFICFDECPKSKLEYLLDLNKRCHIKIMHEDEFLKEIL